MKNVRVVDVFPGKIPEFTGPGVNASDTVQEQFCAGAFGVQRDQSVGMAAAVVLDAGQVAATVVDDRLETDELATLLAE